MLHVTMYVTQLITLLIWAYLNILEFVLSQTKIKNIDRQNKAQ